MIRHNRKGNGPARTSGEEVRPAQTEYTSQAARPPEISQQAHKKRLGILLGVQATDQFAQARVIARVDAVELHAHALPGIGISHHAVDADFAFRQGESR